MFEQAHAGTVSRDKFAREILRIEFEATETIRDLLPALKAGSVTES